MGPAREIVNPTSLSFRRARPRSTVSISSGTHVRDWGAGQGCSLGYLQS